MKKETDKQQQGHWVVQMTPLGTLPMGVELGCRAGPRWLLSYKKDALAQAAWASVSLPEK